MTIAATVLAGGDEDRMTSAIGTKRTCGNVRPMSAIEGGADIPLQGCDFRF
jgi:hypothetical protein